jgi:uncharacterized protein with HEPN domain
MKGVQGDRAALEDVLRYSARVRSHVGKGRKSLDDDLRRDAILYALAIVGEATSRVSEGLRLAHPEVPWRRIVAQRNILIHVYDRLDLDLVWEAVQALAELEANIESILAGLDETGSCDADDLA